MALKRFEPSTPGFFDSEFVCDLKGELSMKKYERSVQESMSKIDGLYRVEVAVYGRESFCVYFNNVTENKLESILKAGK